MAISSPLRTAKVKSQSVPLSNNSIKNIQETLIKQKKVKKEILDRKNKLQDQRRENERRQQLEDQLEAPNLVITPSGPIQMIQNSTKRFLERILGFLGYLTAGWLMNNLATWIAMGKEFIGRVQRLGQIITGLLDNTKNIFIGFGNLLSAAFQNLIQFDLFDTSNRVNSAFENLNGSINDMGKELEEAIQLITSPLSEGITTGENAPPTGSKITDEGAYEPGAPYSGGGGENPKDLKSGAQLLMRKGFSEKGAAYLAGNIQQESGWNAMRKPWVLNDGAGTNKGLISWNRTRITAAEKFLGKPLETATASEQIDWIKEEMKQYGVLKTFQDKNATDEQLKKASYGYIVWGDLGARWKYSEVALQHLRKYGLGSSQSQSTPTQSTLPPLPPTDTLSGGVQRYGASRDGGKRKHAGVDFDISGPDAKFYSRIGGVVTGGQFRYGADGWATDIYNKQLGVYERIAEAAKIVVKPGQIIKPGDLVAVGESNTGVIHYEIRKKIEGGFENTVNPIEFLRRLSTSTSPTQSSPSQPEPQIGSVNSQGKIYVDSKYGYQSRATVIAKGLLPSQDIKPQPSTPQQNLVNPPGALAPGQRPDRALTSEQLKIAQQTREQGKASGLTGEALEKSVAAAVMASSSTTQQTPAQISQSSTQAQQNQQLSQQITPDRRGQTIIFQQPSQSQSLSYSTGGGSGMMPISVNEIALVNNFMKKKLLLDLAYL